MQNNIYNEAEILKKTNDLLKVGQTLGYWTHGYDFPRYCKMVFDGVDLWGKNVLEIGCGKGLYCIWASLQGAKDVVGLEPLEEGSFDQSEIFTEFKKMVDTLKLNNISLRPDRIQDYQNDETLFDIVLSHASVNHLDEDRCVLLKESDEARNEYIDIFKNIASKMNNGGKLILLDCSNRNLFSDLGLTNPIAKQIEWFKHQMPEFWADLLKESGFTEPRIFWPSGRYLRYLRVYRRNKLLSYFMDSAFRLEMTCRK